MPHCRSDYLALPSRSYVWIWRGLVPAAGSALLFGEPKLGKSYLALGLAQAVADPNMTSYLGEPIDQHGPVLYVQLDTPRDLWRAEYVSRTRAVDSMYFLDREDPDLPPEFDVRREDHREWFASQVAIVSPTLVIVDTIRKVHMGDENDSTVMRSTMESLERAVFPAAMVLLAHDNKPTQHDQRSSVARVRGSSYVPSAVDAVIYLTRRGIKIAARSALDFIRAHQGDDGFFVPSIRLDLVRETLETMPPGTPKRERDTLLSKALKISERTARRLRLLVEGADEAD